MDVELKLKIPDSWVEEISQRFPTPIKFIKCLPHGKEGGRGLIEIKVNNQEEIDNLYKEIEKHPAVCKVDFSPIRDGEVLGSVTTKLCVACKALCASDCFLESAVLGEKGYVNWKLITVSNNSLRKLLEKLKDAGCEVELKKITKLDKKSLLTQRQEEIIKMAYERGYYDYPKKIILKNLAKIFEISPSTLQEILQRGEKKIISQHVNR